MARLGYLCRRLRQGRIGGDQCPCHLRPNQRRVTPPLVFACAGGPSWHCAILARRADRRAAIHPAAVGPNGRRRSGMVRARRHDRGVGGQGLDPCLCRLDRSADQRVDGSVDRWSGNRGWFQQGATGPAAGLAGPDRAGGVSGLAAVRTRAGAAGGAGGGLCRGIRPLALGHDDVGKRAALRHLCPYPGGWHLASGRPVRRGPRPHCAG